MYVCMFVCLFVCLYVCMCVCVCVCARARARVCVFIYSISLSRSLITSRRCQRAAHAYIHTCMHACIHTKIHACMHTCRLPLGGAKGRRRSTHLQAEAPAYEITRICHQGLNAFARLFVFARWPGQSIARLCHHRDEDCQKGHQSAPISCVSGGGCYVHTHTWKHTALRACL